MSKAHQFTSETAPRQGGKRGRKNKLSRESLRLIEQLLTDFRKHGQTAINIMRVERPHEYAKLCADVAVKWAIAEQTGQMLATTPAAIRITWLAHPPLDAPPSRNGHSAAPLLELQASVPEDDDDAPTTPAA